MTFIESRSNLKFRNWQSLLAPKGLKKAESFILSGERLIAEFLADPHLEVEAVLLPKGSSSEQKFKSYPETELAFDLFNELDVLGTHYPLLVLKQPEILRWDLNAEAEGMELLCPLGDPQNLGAVVRSAEALGAGAVILLKEAAHPFHPKSVKASAGAILRHPLRLGPSLNALENTNYFALDASGTDLAQWKWPKNLRLLIGEEGAGLPPDFHGTKLKIPMNPKTESLNAAVAASLALFSYRQDHP